MPSESFNSPEAAIVAMNANAQERFCRIEARIEVLNGLLNAVIASHPDPSGFRRMWEGVSPILIANCQIHPGDDPARAAYADEVKGFHAIWHDVIKKLPNSD